MPTNQSPYLITNRYGDEEQSVTCQAFFDTATFTATAGQTTFTLGNTPSGDIQFSRNGMVIADAAASVTGNVVTYVPANNSGQGLVAGDRVEIAYVYNVCTGGATPTIVDGSETKVIAGTGTTVTGAGTAGNPYVVRSASGFVGSYAQLTNTGAVSPLPAVGAKINLTTLRSSSGTRVVPNAAAAQLTLKAGGIYKIEAGLIALFSAAASGLRFGIYAGGTNIGTHGTSASVQHNTQQGHYNSNAHAFLAPTADTVIEIRVIGSASLSQIGGFQLSTGGLDCFLNAYCIGLQ